MKAPAHLAPETRKWFAEFVTTYQLEPHHLRLLQLAAEAWDRCQEARAAIARDGLIALTTGRPHAGVAIERDARLAFARLLRELDLDTSRRRRGLGRLLCAATAARVYWMTNQCPANCAHRNNDTTPRPSLRLGR